MSAPDGQEQRTADLESRATYDHDAAADRADEANDFSEACRSGSAFADMIFEVAKSNMEVSRTAYESGYEAGYKEGQRIGHTAGYRACLDSLEARIKAPS